MTGPDPKGDLLGYLQAGREAVLWKLEGLSEYDVRRPFTPTGTNLLGLVKHLATVELGYFGETFARPSGEPLPWLAQDSEPSDDMWATAAESRDQIIALYHRAWLHADTTIGMLPLEAIGHVPWWPADRSEVTLHRVLVHVIAERRRLILAILCNATSFFAFMALVQKEPLSFAVPASAASFVLETVLAKFVLHEEISARRAAGALAVLAGVVLVGG